MQPRDAAGGVIVNAEGKVVLVYQNGNSWSFPKGGIDAGESLLEAARREIQEETGLSANDLIYKGQLGAYMRRSIGRDGTGEDMSRPESTRTLFLFTTTATELHPEDDEVTEARFVTINEALDTLTHPKDKEFLASVRAQIEDAVK
jgi:bis(5'-nucleosidyl)-tetraphosphatase